MKYALFLIASLISLTPLHARLGDTREAAEARYGWPKADKSPLAKDTLLRSAREIVFEYQGWRIRCALLLASDGREYVVSEEYSPIVKAKRPPEMTEAEVKTIIDAESGGQTWRPVHGSEYLANLGNILQRSIQGRGWLRQDGTIAVAGMNKYTLRFDLPHAMKHETAVVAEQKSTQNARAQQNIAATLPKF